MYVVVIEFFWERGEGHLFNALLVSSIHSDVLFSAKRHRYNGSHQGFREKGQWTNKYLLQTQPTGWADYSLWGDSFFFLNAMSLDKVENDKRCMCVWKEANTKWKWGRFKNYTHKENGMQPSLLCHYSPDIYRFLRMPYIPRVSRSSPHMVYLDVIGLELSLDPTDVMDLCGSSQFGMEAILCTVAH